MTIEEVCDYNMLGEIENGLIESRSASHVVRPGLIKIAVEASLDISLRHLLDAAAEAGIRTSYALQIHRSAAPMSKPSCPFSRNTASVPTG